MSSEYIEWKKQTGGGQFRHDWENRFSIFPEDYSLACSGPVEQIPTKLLQTYVRFYRIGWLHEHGNKCFLMSHLIRRVLRLHGIEAHVKQMTMEYNHKEKGWFQELGAPSNITHSGQVDTHVVCIAQGFILDWAVRDAVHWTFGAMSPIGFIVKNDPQLYGVAQDTGFFGFAAYAPRTNHRLTKHCIYEQRAHELELVKSYFEFYKM